jgi:PAS domain S-box-containing protein
VPMEGSYVFNIYSLVLIFSSIPAFSLAIWIGLKKHQFLFNWFSLMLIASAWWSMAYGFELASQTHDQMLFWIKLEYLGICALPTLWLIFAFTFAGKEHWANPFSISVFSLYSVSTYIIVFTNNSHRLFYSATSVDVVAGPFPLLHIVPGPWYWLHTIIFYGMVVLGYMSLFLYVGNSKTLFRKQNLLVVVATMIPLLVNLTYIFFDIRPYEHIDLTPFAFLITAFIVAMGLLKVGLFDLSPIARAKVINQMRDGFVLIDPLGRVSDFNPSFTGLIGRAENEIVGSSIEDLFDENLSDLLLGSDTIIKRNNHYYELSHVAINQKEKHIGKSILFKDVTERVKSDKSLREQRVELEKSNRLKDRLFSIIAHDLRGPLLNLQEVLALVNSNLLSQEEKESLLSELSRSVDQSVGLMENLLTWASSQQKGEIISSELFEMNLLVTEVLDSINALLLKKAIEVKVNIGASAIVRGDREMIKIVLRNLVSNALKFSQIASEINIDVKAKRMMEIRIKDQGVGMSSEELENLFSMDMRRRLGTENEEGSGLGLVLCKDFIEKNGGVLKVESIEGKGSTFSFTLPLG